MSGFETAAALARPAIVFAIVAGLMALLVWMERKGAAYIQDRRGPNRASLAGIKVGGLVHVLADSIKLLTKEEVTPERAARPFVIIAPMIGFAAIMAAAAVVPFTGDIEIAGHLMSLRVADIGAGLIYAVAASSLGVYAVMLAGYSSRGTYTMLGGMRSAAQMVSYGLALGLSAAALFMVAGSLSISDIVADQSGPIWMWNAFRQPLAFLIFVVALLAVANRIPFDLPEGESEIVGYHAEYSSMRFALLSMAGYAQLAVGSAIVAALFLGGWCMPFLPEGTVEALAGEAGLAVPQATLLAPLIVGAIELGVMLAKTILVCALFIWIRWTLPRFRCDQLMAFGWKLLLPLAMINAVITAFAVLRLRG